jgi:hypothetical protein
MPVFHWNSSWYNLQHLAISILSEGCIPSVNCSQSTLLMKVIKLHCIYKNHPNPGVLMWLIKTMIFTCLTSHSTKIDSQISEELPELQLSAESTVSLVPI